MKHRTILKFIVVIGIMILATILIGATKVQAVTEEYAQNMLDMLPNEISVDLKESEFKEVSNIIEQKAKQIWKENNIDITGIEFWGMYPLIYLPEDGVIYQGSITINGEDIQQWHKSIKIKYNNTNIKNSTDEQIAKNLKLPTMPEYIGYIEDSPEGAFKSIEKYCQERIKDDSIKISAISGAGGMGSPFDMGFEGMNVGIFKNDILYDVRRIEQPYFIQLIEIPNNVKDTEQDYINYALPTVKNLIKKYGDTGNYSDNISMTKGGTIYNYSTKSEIDIENGYSVKDDGEQIGVVILKKAKPTTEPTKEVTKTDTTTNIKLETTSNVVPENTQLEVKKLTTGNTYSIVEKAINNEVSKFVLYDITLKSNNTTIQPNGKVKISIPIPNGYDTSKIVVYRIAEDGTKTKYDTTINNGYVTFETDHFSNYVVAEETTTNNGNDTTKEPTETPKQPDNKPTTSGKLDDTPKTGADNTISVISSIVSVLSIIGIAIIKKF